MATSLVDVANLALQKLGSDRIITLSDDTKPARLVNSCHELLRRRELRAYKWNFALRRSILSPDSTAPAFGYSYAFPLPNGCLRIIPPARTQLDWKVENHNDVPAILTNDGTAIQLRFIKDVTDANIWDPMFIEMYACKIAWHLCESLTQSNTKKEALKNEYGLLRTEARQMNAFEQGADRKQPVDEWLTARLDGQLVNSEWGEE